LESDANLARNRGETAQALRIYTQASTAYERLGMTASLGHVYNNAAGIHFDADHYAEARKLFLKALEMYRETGNRRDVALCLSNLGAVSNSLHHFAEALQFLRQAESIATELGLPYQLAEILHNRSAVLENLGKTKEALSVYKAYRTLDDSLYNLDQAKYVDELHEKYATEKREQQIRELQQKDELSQNIVLARTRQRNFLVILAVSVLLVSALVTLILRQRVKTQKMLVEKNEKIHQQHITELLKEQELRSINSMIEVQDEERKRIAEDLHDRLGSMLSTIKLGFNAVDEKLESMGQFNQQLFEKNMNLLDEAVDEVRKISHNMVSGVLLNFGLEAALRDLKDTVESNTSLKVNLLVNGLGSSRLPPGIEINLYRVIQELINNTLKHAEASVIEIDLNQHRDEINLIVSDNGKGFDDNIQRNGIGLKTIRSRVERMNGTVKIDSVRGNGSTFVIEIRLL
jgi:signal transduction histidine kinase